MNTESPVLGKDQDDLRFSMADYPVETEISNDPPPAVPSGQWRYAAYAVFILVRLALHARDQNFPVHDGAYYVEKATWLAAAPLERALTGEAFAHVAIRPPGPMWLLLPFMILSSSFASFVIGMSFWIAALIEVGVRLVCGPDTRLRNWTAVALLCGTTTFFSPREFFLMDTLFAVQVVAAVGCGVAWLRDEQRRHALLLGLLLALALLTKPAGLYLIASTGAALAAARLVVWRGEQESFIHGPVQALRSLLFWAGGPVGLSLAALVLTPYSRTLEFPDVMKVPGFGNMGLGEPFSADSFRRAVQYTLSHSGALPAVACVTVAGILTWKALAAPGPSRKVAATLFPPAMALLLLICIAATPVIQPRYLIPSALVLLVWMASAAAAVKTASARRAVAACAALALLWQFLALNQMQPQIPGVPVCCATSDKQLSEKALFSAFCAALSNTSGSSSVPVLFTTDLKDQATPFHTSALFADAGVEMAAGMLRAPKKFRFRGPEFPHASVARPFSTDFLNADYLVASRPGVTPVMPPGSGSADWQLINDQLWDPATAVSLGWKELLRTENSVLYAGSPTTEGSEGFEQPAALRRTAWLRNADLRSPDAPALRQRLPDLPFLAGSFPAGRTLHFRSSSSNARAFEFLLHPEWSENKFPSAVRLDIRPEGYVLRARIPAEASDGVLVHIVSQEVGTSATATLFEAHVTREKPAAVALDDLFAASGNKPSNPLRVTVSVTPGPSGSAYCDAVWFRLEPRNRMNAPAL